MPALIAVRPQNDCAAPPATLSAKAAAPAASRITVQSSTVRTSKRAGELDIGDGDRAERAALDGGDHVGAGEGGA